MDKDWKARQTDPWRSRRRSEGVERAVVKLRPRTYREIDEKGLPNKAEDQKIAAKAW